jgi:hypothetical protein
MAIAVRFAYGPDDRRFTGNGIDHCGSSEDILTEGWPT